MRVHILADHLAEHLDFLKPLTLVAEIQHEKNVRKILDVPDVLPSKVHTIVLGLVPMVPVD